MERANRDIGVYFIFFSIKILKIKDILTIWLRDNKTTNWAAALPFVQAMKNQRFHRGIGRSPYEAMFGKKMELGCGKTPVEEEEENEQEEV